MSRFSTSRDIGLRVIIRWAINSFGLWLSARLISDITFEESLWVIVWSGLVLSIINAAIKPLVVILSLPAIVFSLGLFMVFVNGLMVYLVGTLVDSYAVGSFGAAILAGLIIGLVNYAMTTFIEDRFTKEDE